MLKLNNLPKPILFCAAMLALSGELYSVFLTYRKVSCEKPIELDFSQIFPVIANFIIFIIFFLCEKNTYWRKGFSFYLTGSVALFIAKISSSTSIILAQIFCYLSAFSLILALYYFIKFIHDKRRS
jgi:hypothetical protein